MKAVQAAFKTRPLRSTELSTEKRIERYQGKYDLLRTWELQPIDVRHKFHAEIIALAKRVRAERNYILHRADADAKI